MTSVGRRSVLVAVAFTVVASANSEANLTYTCYEDSAHYWFTPGFSGIIVPVYSVAAGQMCQSPTGNLADFSPTRAVGVTQSELDDAILRGLNIWNEESGSIIELRYIGPVASCSVPNNYGVLVTGYSEDSTGTLICPPRGASASHTPVTQNGGWTTGTVEYHKYAPSQTQGVCDSTPYVWTTAPGNDADIQYFVAALIHELGHAVYNIGDIQDPPGTNCGTDGQISVMSYSVGANIAQTLGNWDLEVAQSRYGQRSNYSRFYKTRMLSPTSWKTPMNVNGDWSPNFRRPQFPIASMTERVSPRVLGWVYGPTAVQAGGTGQLDTSTYGAGQLNDWYSLTGSGYAWGRPVAIAQKWQTLSGPATLLVYTTLTSQAPLCGSSQCDLYHTDQGGLCYRISTDYGHTWGFEICPPGQCHGINDQAACTSSYFDCGGFAGDCEPKTTNKYGFYADYDPVSNSFLIAYADNDYVIRVLDIDVAGNIRHLSILGVSSPHAPAIACAGWVGSNPECVMAYQTADSSSNLAWLKFHLASDGSVVIDGSYSQGLLIYDTPSLTVDRDANVYRLAYVSAGNAIYSYSMPLGTGTTWSGTGDIFNDVNSHVSKAALSSRSINSSYTRPYAWFVKYW